MESHILQELLEKEWDTLSPENQALQRSRQAKLGYKCSNCGRVGFIRRTCPSCPPVCYDHQERKLCIIKEEGYTLELNEQQSVRTMKRLPDNSRGIDEPLTPSTFQGWYPRWAAQTGKPSKFLNTGDHTAFDQYQHLGNVGKAETIVSDNLYVTLCRLVEGLKNALMEWHFKTTAYCLILCHERVPWREKDCPPSEWIKKEYSTYFAEEAAVLLLSMFRYLGGLRVEDDQRYLFDRTYLPTGSSLLRHHLNLVEQKRAEERCTTKMTPSKDEKHRPRDVIVKSESVVEQQGVLLQQREVMMEQQRRNAQHLLDVLHKEIMAECRREHDLLTCSQKELNMKSFVVLQERAQSADRIIDTLMEYGLFPRMEEFEHVLYSLKHISSCMKTATMKERPPISARRSK